MKKSYHRVWIAFQTPPLKFCIFWPLFSCPIGDSAFVESNVARNYKEFMNIHAQILLSCFLYYFLFRNVFEMLISDFTFFGCIFKYHALPAKKSEIKE